MKVIFNFSLAKFVFIPIPNHILKKKRIKIISISSISRKQKIKSSQKTFSPISKANNVLHCAREEMIPIAARPIELDGHRGDIVEDT